jgi:hypothetical protein
MLCLSRRIRVIAAVLGCAPMLGCAMDMTSTLVEPGKYEFYNCDQLALQIPGMKKRKADLQSLANRASRGIGGSAIAAVTYQPEISSIDASLRQIEQEQRTKQCDTSGKSPT